MPSVTVSEDDKKYIERLRKKMPFDKVPNVKKTIELILSFLKEVESDYIEWIEKRKAQEG